MNLRSRIYQVAYRFSNTFLLLGIWLMCCATNTLGAQEKDFLRISYNNISVYRHPSAVVTLQTMVVLDDRKFNWMTDLEIDAVVKRFTNLRDLRICESRITGRGLALICKVQSLKSLSFEGRHAIFHDDIACIGNLKNLEELALPELDQVQMRYFKKLLRCKKLKKLDLSNARKIEEDFYDVLKKFPSLESLNLRGVKIKPGMIEQFLEIKKLKSLIFDGSNLTEVEFEKLLSEVENLTELTAYGHKLSDKTIEDLERRHKDIKLFILPD